MKPEEVPLIPRLAKRPKAVVYSPLADAPLDPDVALVRLRPAAAMLLEEAADARELAPGRRRSAGQRAWRCRLR